MHLAALLLAHPEVRPKIEAYRKLVHRLAARAEPRCPSLLVSAVTIELATTLHLRYVRTHGRIGVLARIDDHDPRVESLRKGTTGFRRMEGERRRLHARQLVDIPKHLHVVVQEDGSSQIDQREEL
eukprot:6997079-Prymnesium_polylepis.3